MNNKEINQNEKVSGIGNTMEAKKDEPKFDIEKSYKGNHMVVYAKGRIDTQTSPEFQSYIDEYLEEDFEDLTIDFSEVEYISSAGLRAILYIQKRLDSMDGEHEFSVINVNEAVMEIFDMTGFTDIINIKQK